MAYLAFRDRLRAAGGATTPAPPVAVHGPIGANAPKASAVPPERRGREPDRDPGTESDQPLSSPQQSEPSLPVLDRPSPVPLVVPCGPNLTAPVPTSEFSALLEDWVSQIAWSTRRGSRAMRLQIGKGHLAGTVVVVREINGRVAVDLELVAGQDREQWESRLRERLEQKGVEVESLNVR